jgi:beta-lactamase class A
VRVAHGVSSAIALTLVLALGAPAQVASATPADDLRTALTGYLSTVSADYTISVHELGEDGIEVGIDEHVRIEPASVVKLFYAWAALRRVDMGSLRLSQVMSNGLTWDRCITLMITISDNKCSADIRQALGNRTLNTLFAASGYSNTYIRLTARGAYNGKRTSAADTTLLFTRLEEGTLLTPASTTYFHELLKGQVWRTRINLGVPAGVRVENKGGDLVISSGATQSDAAIVRGPESTYVLTVYGRNNAAKADIAAISRIVFEHLQGQTVTTPASFSTFQYTAVGAVPVRAKPGGRILYRIPSGTLVKAYYSERNWMVVKQNHKRQGWVKFQHLRLRDQFRWQ